MCGILGIINFNGKPVDQARLIQARDCMAHRGPDDSGVFISENKSAALAHRRLSMIDLSPLGHQPMTTDDGRYTFIHNGEIYNHNQITSLASCIQYPASVIQQSGRLHPVQRPLGMVSSILHPVSRIQCIVF